MFNNETKHVVTSAAAPQNHAEIMNIDCLLLSGYYKNNNHVICGLRLCLLSNTQGLKMMGFKQRGVACVILRGVWLCHVFVVTHEEGEALPVGGGPHQGNSVVCTMSF